LAGVAQLMNWTRDSQLLNNNTRPVTSAESESYFEMINYYVLKDQRPQIHLDATELTLNTLTERTAFLEPEGVVFTKDQEPVHYKGKRGVLINNEGRLQLDEEVNIRLNSSEMDSKQVIYFLNKEEMISTGDVKTKTITDAEEEKIFVNSDKVTSWTKTEKSRYEGNVRGHIKRRKAYEENIYFSSDTMDLDQKAHLAELEGNVRLKKQLVKASSLRGEIFLENYNKKLKYFVLYDDVKVVEKVMLEGSTEYFNRRAFAEKLEGFMGESLMVLTGYPKVFQQGDVIKGNKIILRENNEVVEVDDANSNFILR
jgi:LPS export ABC transporter protein LptC